MYFGGAKMKLFFIGNYSLKMTKKYSVLEKDAEKYYKYMLETKKKPGC